MNVISCTRCGACCNDAILPIIDSDVNRIQRATGLPASKIVRFFSIDHVHWPEDSEDWVALRPGRRLMAIPKVREKCLFFRQGGCAIYAHRPRVCRVFPIDFHFNESATRAKIEIQDRVKTCQAKIARKPKKSEELYRIARALHRTDLAYYRKVARWNASNPRGTIREFLAFLKLY